MPPETIQMVGRIFTDNYKMGGLPENAVRQSLDIIAKQVDYHSEIIKSLIKSIETYKNNMLPETIQIPREWLDKLLSLKEDAEQTNIEREQQVANLNYLLGYIESAKSLLK